MHLKQPELTSSACGPFTKKQRKNSKFMQTGNINYIYKNNLDKDFFQHDIAYSKYKDLAKRTESNKFFRDKALKIAIIQKVMDMKEDQLQWFTSFLIKNQKVVVLNLCQSNNLQSNCDNIW